MKTKNAYELEVKRDLLVKLYNLLGFKTADKWDCKRLQKKIINLPDYIGENGAELKNDKAQKFLDKILDALKQGQVIVVVDEKEDMKTEKIEKDIEMVKKKETKKEVVKKKETKKVVKKVKTAKKEKVKEKKNDIKKKEKVKKNDITKKNEKVEKKAEAFDVFGSKIGSNNAKINACFSKHSKTMSQLIEESKTKGTFYEHCKKLIEKNLIQKTKDGYKLV